MKIGILIDQLVPGGVQKSAIREARELKTLGHEVTLFVLIRENFSYHYQDLTAGLKVVFLSDYNPRIFKKPLHLPYFSFLTHLHIISPLFVQRYHILKTTDFIISHGTTTCITAHAISRKLRIPYLAFIWDPMVFILQKVYGPTLLRYLFPIIKPVTKYYENKFLTGAAIVATSSQVHKEFIIKNYKIQPLIIYPGCNPVKLYPQKSGNYILGYSRWELAKNPYLFLEIAENVPKANILIAGLWTNPDEEQQFRREISVRHLVHRVILQSAVDNRELSKLAAKSLFWLHPNFEAFGMSGLEMAALGLPIIIPQGSGITEIFKHQIHGFFPESKNTTEFIKYAQYLYNHPHKAHSMGISAAGLARQYTWKKHAMLVYKNVSLYLEQIKVVCVNNAYVSRKAIAGGDLFLIELVKRIPTRINLTLIMPEVGYFHWQKLAPFPENIRFQILKSNRFDNRDQPLALFFAYLNRCLRTYFLLNRLPDFNKLYTATDIISDVLPAWFFRKINPGIPWTARFFHFVESPLSRAGKLWVNIGAYLLQRISLNLITTADNIMVDNLELVNDLTARNILPERITYQPGGVDITQINQAVANSKYASDALFIGRLQPHKGIFDCLKAWALVTREIPRAKLKLIGYGPQNILEDINRAIKEAKLSRNISLTGYIHNRNQLAKYLKSSRLLLFLDHEAGFGLVVAEAMAAGLPVIAYNLPIFGTVYKHGFMTVPLKEISLVSETVIRLLKNNTEYHRVSQEAIREAKRFDWNRVSKRFYQQMYE